MRMTTRRRSGPRPGVARGRSGITLIEILVSLTLLVVVLSSLAALTVSVGQQANSVSSATYGAAQMGEQVGQLMVVPFDSLAARNGCQTTTSAQSYAFTKCIGVSSVTRTQRRITLVLTPRVRRVRADTVIFDRTRPQSSSPFNTP